MKRIWAVAEAGGRFWDRLWWWLYVAALCWCAAVYIIGSLHAGRLLTDDELIRLAFRVR